MTNLLTPPITFIILLALVLLFTTILAGWAFKNHKKTDGSETSYACGEEFDGHAIQPDLGQFFPVAFFFTLLHVVVLVIATVPRETSEIFYIVVSYIICAVVSLLILFRR